MMQKNSQSGFTLIELAIVITISGLLLGGIMKVMQPYISMAQRNATIKDLNLVADSLSEFAQMYGYLPCPGKPNPTVEPFGAAGNSDASGFGISSASCDTTGYVGIVPFKTLGIDESLIYDGYDNLITYAVGPGFSGSEIVGAAVHEMCRTPKWRDPDTGLNKNPRKATICCPNYIDWAVDIQVYEDTAYMHPVYNGTHTNFIPRYSVADDFLPAGTQPDTGNQVIAFALLSHGDNGEGAYQPRSDDTNAITTHVASPDRRNASNGTALISVPRNLSAGAGYFDDIVVWRTNDQVISAFGNDSCSAP